ncbi:GHMP kinase [Candidatus Saccharibacteria bacterium]|nr:GHMP kinase [Candidatus Saccharibacteria bacterium]
MEERAINLFVPGRLCIMGEHSDWAGRYRNINNKLNKGYAIVTGIEEGIYATATISDKVIVENVESGDSFECEMDYDKLKEIAEEGGYWSYIAGVAACIKEQYNVGGVKIAINKVTIPEKKGLSSSAAICVLVARAFNQLYNLHLNVIGEMNLAYLGEITTPSRCGKLDQACAFGKKPVLLTFDGDRIDVKNIKVSKPLYFVFADLMSKKDTVKILADLNRSFPFAENEIDEKVQEALGVDNDEIVHKCIEYIESGDVEKVGEMMLKAQQNFDEKVAPACPEELTSPALHKVLNDEYIVSNSFGRKGVGSQGDGSVQVLAKNKESQDAILKYFKDVLGMDAYTLTIEETKPIKKAIIPVAGNGTRMFPITKCIKKAFLPVIDDDGIIKPVILSLAEEISDAGIEEICLVIDEGDKEDYDKLFKGKLSSEVAAKLSPELLEYEAKIQKIGKKIKYVYQTEKLGFGHAVSLCEEFAGGEPVLLALGDQLYKSDINESCTEQFLKNFAETNQLSVSVCEIPEGDVSRYGILSGKLENSKDYFYVDKMVEKPDVALAAEEYYTKCGDEKKYFAVFGEYILTKEVFDLLRDNIENNRKEGGEFELTSVLDQVREKNGMVAFIPKGKFFDVGNVKAYKRTFVEK